MNIPKELDELLDLTLCELHRVDEIVRVRAKEMNATCGRCTKPWCCYQTGIATFMDGLIAARTLKKEGRDTKDLRAALENAGEKMMASKNSDYFQQCRPCVFLENDRCSIYEHRPFTCRVHLMLQEPEKCSPCYKEDTAYVDNSDLIAGWIGSSFSLVRSFGIDDNLCLLTFPSMVLLCLQALDMPQPLDHIFAHEFPSTEEFLKKVGGMKLSDT